MTSWIARWWPIALLLFALAGCAYVAHRTIDTGLYTDFEMLYRSAGALRSGSDLYDHGNPVKDGNLNPPHVAVAMLPLAWMSLQEAAIAGWLVIAASAIGVAWVLRGVLSPWWTVVAMAIALASPAGYLGVRFINLGWPIALGVTVAWVAMREGRHARAGVLLGCLATVKVFLLVFVLYFAWRRQWRALMAGIIAGTATLVLGVLVCGINAYVGWAQELRAIQWQANSLNASLYGLLQRSFDAHARGGFAPVLDLPALVTPLWIVATVGLMAAMVFRFRRDPDLDSEWAALLIAALLVSPLGWSYYWAFVVGPVAATLMARRRSWLEAVSVGFSLLPFFLLTKGQPSPWLTVTWASAYTWGGLLLWLTIVLGARPAGRSKQDADVLSQEFRRVKVRPLGA